MTQASGPVGDVVPFWWRAVGEGPVHGVPCQGGEVVGKGQDGHRMSFVQEDGSEYGVAEEATEVCRTQTPVVKGISVRRGDGPKTPDGVGGEGVVDRGAIHGQEEGLVAPEDEDSPGSGRAVAPDMTPLGEPGREPPMVVGAKERVERAGKDPVARGGQETEGAGRFPGGGEQGKANAGDREVVPHVRSPWLTATAYSPRAGWQERGSPGTALSGQTWFAATKGERVACGREALGKGYQMGVQRPREEREQ